jgi:hypothetical protein
MTEVREDAIRMNYSFVIQEQPSFARLRRVEDQAPHGRMYCNDYAACPALTGNASAPSVRV